MRTYLLVEDGLSLTTVTGLLTVVTTLSLRGQRILALLVLGHLVGPARRSKRSTPRPRHERSGDVRVLPALLALAVCKDPSQYLTSPS